MLSRGGGTVRTDPARSRHGPAQLCGAELLSPEVGVPRRGARSRTARGGQDRSLRRTAAPGSQRAKAQRTGWTPRMPSSSASARVRSKRRRAPGAAVDHLRQHLRLAEADEDLRAARQHRVGHALRVARAGRRTRCAPRAASAPTPATAWYQPPPGAGDALRELVGVLRRAAVAPRSRARRRPRAAPLPPARRPAGRARLTRARRGQTRRSSRARDRRSSRAGSPSGPRTRAGA